MKWTVILIMPLILVVWFLYTKNSGKVEMSDSIVSTVSDSQLSRVSTSGVTSESKTNSVFPDKKNIEGLSYVHQSFNNCSSVALMITLSKWGIVDTQEKIAEATRPWNNPKGDNDDKSVTLPELANYARTKHGMITYVRPNGDIETLKKFVANDIPVLTRALMYPKDDIVHYRVIRGYDENKKIVIESDGVEGQNQPYSYEQWMHMWKDFNYSYLIIVPKDKKQLVEKLLGDDLDEMVAWENAKNRAINEISKDNKDLRAKYNLITASYYLNDYESTIKEFEKIENKLTRRKLWYQIEPIEAYFALKKYNEVIKMVDYMANDNNKSISELYVLKGKIFEKNGNIEDAKKEYQKAIYYNKNLEFVTESL